MLGFLNDALHSSTVASASALSALASFDDIPNQEALALSPTVGWLMLAAALTIFALFILNSGGWRRFWMTLEDPRSIGLYRIVFGIFVIANVNDFYEYFTYLFTDEGIFTADVARQVHASSQFVGFGDGFTDDEPWGFFDVHAFLKFLEGPKYSLLYFWDSPTFFWGYMIAFQLSAAAFVVGFRTRFFGILTFILMNGLFVRNHLFWEGTELVYRVFLAYLICAKAGHAYSIDNWLRCRKLRKQGRLSERDGPGGGAGLPPSDEHPAGLEPIYRLIPSWPRKLMMLQLAVVYATTGILKNGNVWAQGDAIYYAWNMDHFYRFYPQPLSAMFGTNLLRVATWTTHWGEALFFVVIFGVIVHWSAREYVPKLRPWQRLGTHLCWAALIALSSAILWVTYPVHFTPPIPVQAFVGGWVAACVAAWGVWMWLGWRPPTIKGITFDRRWAARWIFGRRIWLVFHLGLMGGIFILMNIGQFQTGMLSQGIIFFTGYEVARTLRFFGRRLGRMGLPGIPEDVKKGEPPVPPEDPTLPHHHRDTARIPQWAAFTALAIFAVGVYVRAEIQPEWEWRWIWAAGFLFLAGVAFQRWRASRGETLPLHDEQSGKTITPWAYGPFGRFVIGSLIIWQLTAVATWLLPEKDSLGKWRGEARQVFAKWLTVTQTDQGWGMFAPNPPRSNVFLKVLVTDQEGEVFDLKTDVYAPERKPIPWIWNDRMRKMNRRIIGGESGNTQWYRKWHARYHCRQWALTHGGETPEKVELVKVWYRIPPPEEVAQKGWYKPEELLERSGHEKVEHTEYCERSIMGQLPNEIRERHGLPPLPEDLEYRPWIKHKKRQWEKRMERRAND